MLSSVVACVENPPNNRLPTVHVLDCFRDEPDVQLVDERSRFEAHMCPGYRTSTDTDESIAQLSCHLRSSKLMNQLPFYYDTGWLAILSLEQAVASKIKSLLGHCLREPVFDPKLVVEV